jgi:hypothetical protein
LWIEPDCLLCRAGVEEYLEYDYIGAPWHEKFSIAPSCRVGNGGLSLRRKSVMLDIAERCNRDHKLMLSEDVFFCVNMHLRNAESPGVYHLPGVEAAGSFAVESLFRPSPFGLHKIWKYLPAHRVSELLNGIDY